MIRKIGALTAFICCLVLTGCSTTDGNNNTNIGSGTGGESSSSRPVSEESAETVYEDWIGAITGTVGASGRTTYISEGGREFPGSGRTLEDYMPGRPCGMSSTLAGEAGYISLYISTYGQDLGYAELEEPLAKVAAYWESRGWEPRTSGGGNGAMQSIATTTTRGTFIQYTASAGGEDIEAKSPCVYEFNPDYDPNSESDDD